MVVFELTKSKMLNSGLQKPNPSNHPLKKPSYQVFETITTRIFSSLRQYGPHHNTESLTIGYNSSLRKQLRWIQKT